MYQRILANFSIALEAVLANKLRSLLTGLGIIFGVAAVIAALGTKLGVQVRVLATRFLDHPVAVQTRGDVVLVLAGHHAIPATDAGSGIDDHGIVDHLRPPRGPG